jgi:hypothetical protein
VEREARLVESGARRGGQGASCDRVSFRQGDIFETDLRGATVVTLYLLPACWFELVPKLRAELAPARASFRTTIRSSPGAPTRRWNSTCRKRMPADEPANPAVPVVRAPG